MGQPDRNDRRADYRTRRSAVLLRVRLICLGVCLLRYQRRYDRAQHAGVHHAESADPASALACPYTQQRRVPDAECGGAQANHVGYQLRS